MDEHFSQLPDKKLEKLALRLSTSPGDPRTPDPQLLAGQIPGDLPFNLPLPQDSTVLGSLLKNAEQTEIVLDSMQSPENVLAFYKEQLLSAGWSEPVVKIGSLPGGFASTGYATTMLFCKGDRGPSLTVTAFAEKAGYTNVRLSIDRSTRTSPCARAPFQRMISLTLIPSLQPPQRARHALESGRMGGHGDATSSATLELETELHPHAFNSLCDTTGAGRMDTHRRRRKRTRRLAYLVTP